MTQNETGQQHSEPGGNTPPAVRARTSHAFVAIVCAAVAITMLGMAFAAVPLYQMFCRVTGYGGTTRVAVSVPDHVLDRTVTIRFESNVSGALPWTFKPVTRTIKVRIGDQNLATYTASNNSSATTVGTAAFNVTPESAGLYFNKIECFCFTEQILEPGATAQMPVSFFIDPAFVTDSNTRHLSEITLSYTFFPTDSDAAGNDQTEIESNTGTGSNQATLQNTRPGG